MRYTIEQNKKNKTYKESLIEYGCFRDKLEALKYALKAYKSRSYILKRFETTDCTSTPGTVYMGKKIEEEILTKKQVINILEGEK